MNAKRPDTQKHTPGPWQLEREGKIRLLVRTQPGRCYAFHPNDEANARLIAAAPDLYRIVHEQREVIQKQDAALRAALEPLELYHAYGWPDRAGVRAKLKAALAAAAPYILED